MLENMSPSDIGLPNNFAAWRPVQDEAIEQAVYSDKRFEVLVLPTGSGKTLTVMTILRILGKRGVILTGTLGLQDQYAKEFGDDQPHLRVLRSLNPPKLGEFDPNAVCDIRGKANYQCEEHPSRQCDDGARMKCRFAGTLKCSYGSAIHRARGSIIDVTNYKFWMYFNAKGNKFSAIKPMNAKPDWKTNPVEILVLDEAHLADKELAGFLAIRIYEKEIYELLHVSPPSSEDTQEWRQLGRDYLKTIELEIQTYSNKIDPKRPAFAQSHIIDHIRRLDSLHEKLDKLHGMEVKDWVCEEMEPVKSGRRWELHPIWPGAHAERYLFQGIPKVLLVTATGKPKTMSVLGVKSDQYRLREWGRVFPANRCPVYHIPQSPMLRINRKTSHQDLLRWVALIDEIISSRLDRKGIIHTVSYKRQEFILAHSRFAHLMYANTSDTYSVRAQDVYTAYRAASSPALLCSPSFSTGWDFPGDSCEYQIIGKVPYPDIHSKVMKARMARDAQYPSYLAMQELVQASGRGMRSKDDRCETFIADDGISWFMSQNRGLAPKWFEIRRMAAIPVPAPKLT